jgi:hypothetical protein
MDDPKQLINRFVEELRNERLRGKEQASRMFHQVLRPLLSR